MTRWFTYSALFAAPLTLLVLAPPAPAQEDEESGGMLVGFLEDTLSGDGRNIAVRGLEGALSSRATIEQITVSDDDGVWLTISDAVLDWNRLALVRGRFSVNALTAREIDIARAPGATQTDTPPPSAETQPFQVPELPVAVELGEIRVDRLVLGEPLIGVAAELEIGGNLTLADGTLDTKLDITRLDQPGDKIGLSASFENESRQIGLDLQVSESAGGLISTALRIPDAPQLGLTAKGNGPVDDFTADIALSSAGSERVAGQVRLRGAAPVAGGETGAIAFTADLGGDLTPFLADDLDAFFGTETRLFVDGRSDPGGKVELSDLQLTSNALRLEGQMSLAAGGKLEKVALQARITPPSDQSVVLPVAGGQTRLGAAQLSGLFDQANGNLWDLSLTANALETPEIQLQHGRLTAQGTLEQGTSLRLDGDLQAALTGLKMTDPALNAALGERITLDGLFGLRDDSNLELSDFELAGADYTLGLDALIDGLNSGFHVDGSAALQAEDLSRFSALAGLDLAGSVAASITGNGSPLEGSFDGQLQLSGENLATGRTEFDPLISGTPTITLDAVRGGDGLTIRSFTLDGSALTARASAVVTSPGGALTVDGKAELDAPDLSIFSGLAGRDLGGALQASVEGKGTPETLLFDARADLSGQDLKTGMADIDPLLAGRTVISLDAARTANQVIIRKAHVDGTALGADVVATITDPEGALKVEGADIRLDAPDLSLFSGLAGRELGGALTARAQGSGTKETRVFDVSADVDASALKTGIAQLDGLLDGRTTLVLDAANGDNGLDVTRFALNAPALSAKAQGNLTRDTGALQFSAELDDLSRVIASLSGPLNLEGNVTPTGAGLKGNVSLTGPDSSFADLTGTVDTDGNADLQFDAKFDRLERFLPDFPGSASAKGSARRDAGVWTIDLDTKGPAQIGAAIAGTYDEAGGDADMTAKGSVNIGIANLFIAPNKIEGTAEFDVALKGQPGLDALSGRVSTSGTTLAIPGAGQTLTDIGGTVDIAQSRAEIALQGGMRAGGGFTVSGPVDLTAPFNGQITTALNDLVLTDKRLFDTSLNGQLVLSGPLAGNSSLAGQIQFGETNINLAAASGAVGAAAIPPITHEGEPQASLLTRERANLVVKDDAEAGESRIALDIGLLAPKAVFVRGRGLNAELGGRIHIGGNTAAVVPSGQIELIRGVLDILGRRLTLTKGIVTLQGDLTPYIEFSSSTSTADGTATIEISGPLNAPKVDVYSDPERPAEEALAMLLFGNRFSELSPFVIAQMAASLAQLSGAGGDATKGIRKITGADTVDIGAAEGGGGQFGAGAYLADNLYTDFTVNTEGDTEVNLNLDLNDNFTVRGTVDGTGQTGLGIFFERDY